MLGSDLCDFSDAYVVMKGDITITEPDNAKKKNKRVALKNNATFINCISKINGVQTDNAEDLDYAMLMYNLLNTAKITEKQQAVCEITETNQVILFLLILNLLNTRKVLLEILTILLLVMLIMMPPLKLKIIEIVVPLKHLSNFWRTLNIQLIVKLN